MVKEMDVVTLNCPLHPETEHMVNAETIKLFRDAMGFAIAIAMLLSR